LLSISFNSVAQQGKIENMKKLKSIALIGESIELKDYLSTIAIEIVECASVDELLKSGVEADAVFCSYKEKLFGAPLSDVDLNLFVTYEYPESYLLYSPDTEAKELAIEQWSEHINNVWSCYLDNLEQLTLVNQEELVLEPVAWMHQLVTELHLSSTSELKASWENTAEASAQAAENTMEKAKNVLAFDPLSEAEEQLKLMLAATKVGKAAFNQISDRAVRFLSLAKEQVGHSLFTQTKVFEENLAELKAENELSQLQINQLQEELEQYFLESQFNDNNLKELKAELALAQDKKTILQKELDEQIANTQAELELSTLQIHQLQEELELYYIKYVELEAKTKSFNLTNPALTYRAGAELVNTLKLMQH
jgi:hypothetical protein